MCALTLISSPHLARSYHHLFPVPRYDELKADQVASLLLGTPQIQHQKQLLQEQQQQQQQSCLEGGEDKTKGPPVKKQCMEGGVDPALQPAKAGTENNAAGVLPAHSLAEVPHALYCFGCLLDLTPPGFDR